MDQRQYNALRNQYAKRQGEEEYLPYSVFFRLRLVLAVVLFIFFAYAERNVLTEAEKEAFYQAMESNTTPASWKNYAVSAFSSFQETGENEKSIREQ